MMGHDWTRLLRGPTATRGFALPGVIIVLTVLFVVAVPTVLTVQQEWKVSNAIAEATEANEAVEEVTYDLLAAWDTAFFRLGVWDDTTFTDEDDRTKVRFTVTRTAPQLFMLEAHATGSGENVVRSSALTVRASTMDMTPHGLLTVSDGAELGSDAVVEAIDYVVPPDWPSSVCEGSTKRDLPGVTAPDTASINVDPNAWITGSPRLLASPSVNASTLARPAGLDYAALVKAADISISGLGATPIGGCDPKDPASWGDPMNATGTCGDHFPIIHVSNSLTLPPGTRGQGILLVDGDLRFAGDAYFYGLVVTQGGLEMTGTNNRIRGAAYAAKASLQVGYDVNPTIANVSCAFDRIRSAHPELGGGVYPVSSRSWVDLSGTR